MRRTTVQNPEGGQTTTEESISWSEMAALKAQITAEQAQLAEQKAQALKYQSEERKWKDYAKRVKETQALWKAAEQQWRARADQLNAKLKECESHKSNLTEINRTIQKERDELTQARIALEEVAKQRNASEGFAKEAANRTMQQLSDMIRDLSARLQEHSKQRAQATANVTVNVHNEVPALVDAKEATPEAVAPQAPPMNAHPPARVIVSDAYTTGEVKSADTRIPDVLQRVMVDATGIEKPATVTFRDGKTPSADIKARAKRLGDEQMKQSNQ